MLKARSASQPSPKFDTLGFLRDEGDSDKMEPTQRESGSEFDTTEVFPHVSPNFQSDILDKFGVPDLFWEIARMVGGKVSHFAV